MNSIKPGGTRDVAVDNEVVWRYDVENAPAGQAVHLLTIGGTTTQGIYRKDGGFIAWFKFFRRDAEEEKRRGIR